MPGWLLDLLVLLGSLCLMLFGIKIMSESLQSIAGARLREVLRTMTADRFRGVLTGFTTTVVIQLSSVTTVMVVSFVNAGLLTLRQSISVIMGANIGTTVKALVISAFAFDPASVSAYALPIMGLAFPLLFAKSKRKKALAEFLIGFALLFVALGFLRTAVPSPSAEIMAVIESFTHKGLLSVLLFVVLGIVFTVLVQSSSVAMAATMVMAQGGFIGYEMAAATVLGHNIGTTVTANLAALVGNVWAKRAARAHLMFNVIGVCWALLFFGPYLHVLDAFVQHTYGASPHADDTALVWALTWMHISFNTLNTLLLIGFVPWLEKLVTRMVPARSAEDEEHRLAYMDSGMALSPELSLLEARKEVLTFGKLAHRMLGMVRELLTEQDVRTRETLLLRLARYEKITDRIEVEISRYLIKSGSESNNEESSEGIRSMLAIIGDLERVGDIFYQMGMGLERKASQRLWFTPEQRGGLLELMDLLERAFVVMVRNLEAERGQIELDQAAEVEQLINQKRDTLRRAHLKSVETGDYNIQSGLVYSDLFHSCEKVGDHLINVSEALVGEV
jgi:phosphate:Na+ symporter